MWDSIIKGETSSVNFLKLSTMLEFNAIGHTRS